MTKTLVAIVLAWLSFTGLSAAEELKAGSAHSIRLADYTGNFYYTQEQQGYRVVATLASGTDGSPIRFVAVLLPGQHMVVSVPQATGQGSLDFDIARSGDTLVVTDPRGARGDVGEMRDGNVVPVSFRN